MNDNATTQKYIEEMMRLYQNGSGPAPRPSAEPAEAPQNPDFIPPGIDSDLIPSGSAPPVTLVPEVTPAKSDPVPAETSKEKKPAMTASGKLRIEASTGSRAFPVADALVIIRESDGDPVAFTTTDMSGKTQTFTLPAPGRSLSERPSDIQPFALYDVETYASGYYGVINRDVSVFPDTISLLPVSLIPLPEEKRSGEYILRGKQQEL